jgi:hypothetical protein
MSMNSRLRQATPLRSRTWAQGPAIFVCRAWVVMAHAVTECKQRVD